jgi:hypothetical protein
MKTKQLFAAVICATGLWAASATGAKASEVLYDGIGFFTGQQSFQDSFALSGPGTLTVTVSDIAWPTPLSQLDFIVSNTQSLLGPEMGAGTASYKISGAQNVFVQMFGTAQGPLDTGVYGLDIQWTPAVTAVPLPASVALLLSGLAILAWQRRQRSGHPAAWGA